MSAADNKAITQRFFNEVINGRNFDVIGEMVADDFVEHESFPGLPTTGPAAPRANMEMFAASFPDFRITPDEMIAEGDKVAIMATMTGTHKGEFMGIPPTDKSFEVQVMDVVQYRDGKAIAHWGLTDAMAMMEQLGVMGGPPPA